MSRYNLNDISGLGTMQIVVVRHFSYFFFFFFMNSSWEDSNRKKVINADISLSVHFYIVSFIANTVLVRLKGYSLYTSFPWLLCL